MVGESVERHLVVEALAKKLEGAADRARVLALRAGDRAKRGVASATATSEREPTRASLHRVVETLEGGAARVSAARWGWMRALRSGSPRWRGGKATI